MIKFISLAVFTLYSISGFAQVKIHSHNDYEQKRPFHLAYESRVYEMEADIFEVKGQLLVSHSKKALNNASTLENMYFKPIDSLFKINKGSVSKDKNYSFHLMIDFKTPFDQTYPVLATLVKKYGDIFDSSKNKRAVKIVISGNRPPDSTFHKFPNWLYFDGLPNVDYAKADFDKVVMISDDFKKYSAWDGIGALPEADELKLREVIKATHKRERPIRFWGGPDTADSWQALKRLGADIINTDKIVACKTYFK